MDGEAAIRFMDAEVLRLLTTEKAFCDFISLNNNGYLRLVDLDGDGMITMEEAANVKSLSKSKDNNGSIFGGNTVIETFNEFQYFTGLTAINSGCFEGCTNLHKVTLPPLTIMNDSVFKKSGIEEIIIPEGYISIGSNIVEWCTQCRLIDFPSTVTSIGNSLLWAVKDITTIVCRAITPPTLGGWGYNGIPVVIYVPDESVNAYKTATNWSEHANRIKPMSEKT